VIPREFRIRSLITHFTLTAYFIYLYDYLHKSKYNYCVNKLHNNFITKIKSNRTEKKAIYNNNNYIQYVS